MTILAAIEAVAILVMLCAYLWQRDTLRLVREALKDCVSMNRKNIRINEEELARKFQALINAESLLKSAHTPKHGERGRYVPRLPNAD